MSSGVSAARPPDPLQPPGATELQALYRELDLELASLKPRCELSGRCCNFKESGMTLFATDLEIAHLRATTPPGRNDDPQLCPWWEGGLCTAREGRPLGCRVYFCDTTKAAELEALSIRFHDRLKRLHEQTGVVYRYSPFVVRVRESA